MRASGGILVGLVLSMGIVVTPEASAQVLHGCYNKSGVLYLIDEPGLKTECKDDHVEIDWNVTGPPGAQGPPGLSGIHVVQSDVGVTVGAADVEAASAFCPGGEVATGGGNSEFTVLMIGIEPAMIQSAPFLDMTTGAPIGWTVIYANRGTGEFSFKAAVICAVVGP